MKHVSNLIDLNTVKQQRETETMEQAPSPETAQVINWLFSELRSNFSAFKQAWPTNDEFTAAKKVWLKAFMLAGINRIEQLQHGLNKCYLMETPFVPTAGQFIAWCKPNPRDFGFPDPIQAFSLSGRINQQFGDYVHPHVPTDTVIRHVIQQIGAREFRGMAEKSAFKLFENYYEVACRQFMEGQLEPIKRALTQTPEPHPIDRVKADEARKRCMDELRSKGIAINRRVQEDNIQPRH